MHVTELTRKSTSRRSRRALTRRTTSYIHTIYYAPTFLPSPSPRAHLLSKVSLPLALARKDRPVAATARTSCSCSISEPRSPMPLTAAADASREREKERERETQWRNAVSAIRRTARASIGSVRTARSRRSEEGADRRTTAQQGSVHTPNRHFYHSVAYRRAACLPRREQRITTSARASLRARCSTDKAFPGASRRAGCSWNRSVRKVCERTTAAALSGKAVTS